MHREGLYSPSRLRELLVDRVLAEPWSHALELRHQIAELFDALNLLAQIVALQKVGHVRVRVAAGDAMQVEQRLVHMLLQLQCCLHGVHAATVLETLGRLYVLKDDAATTHVLKLHEFLGVLSLLIRLLLEELGETLECHVVAIKVEAHGLVGVRGVQLKIDLFIHAGLTLLMVVLAGLRLSCHVAVDELICRM